MKCPYCESGTNDFVPMNQTAEYSGIELMAITILWMRLFQNTSTKRMAV